MEGKNVQGENLLQFRGFCRVDAIPRSSEVARPFGFHVVLARSGQVEIPVGISHIDVSCDVSCGNALRA